MKGEKGYRAAAAKRMNTPQVDPDEVDIETPDTAENEESLKEQTSPDGSTANGYKYMYEALKNLLGG